MIMKAQSGALSRITETLQSTDMVLRPEQERMKAQTEAKIAPFRHMSMDLGTRTQQNNFEKLMRGELGALVRSTDCEKGIQMLVETLKKQHVNNFAMQSTLMTSMNKKTEIENWKRALV